MRLNFHFGKKPPSIKQWAIYSISTATLLSIIVYCGNLILMSKHGELFRDSVCSASKVIPDGTLARLLSSVCRASKDKVITPAEAKIILGRIQQATDIAPDYFNQDRENTDLRAKDEVDFAIESWERLNPSPKVDDALRKQFPDYTEAQLCVLSQAEQYVDGNSIGLRYVGMEVCEVKSP